jgi:hypothetical protein
MRHPAGAASISLSRIRDGFTDEVLCISWQVEKLATRS